MINYSVINSIYHQMQRDTKIISLVISLNLFYFLIEYYFAQKISSVSLFADSIDFLEDACSNFIALLFMNIAIIYRRYVTYLLLSIFILPAFGAILLILQKINTPIVPEPFTLTYIALGALLVNLICSVLLSKYKNASNTLLKLIYFSARNDVLSNLAIISAGLITIIYSSQLPDLVVGTFILIINLFAIREIVKDLNKK